MSENNQNPSVHGGEHQMDLLPNEDVYDAESATEWYKIRQWPIESR